MPAPPRPVLAALAWRLPALFGTWVILGHADAKGLGFGIAAAGFAAWASLRLLPPCGLRLRPVAALALLLMLPWQALRAGTQVALLALDPRRPLRPGIVPWRSLQPPGLGREAFLTYAALLPGSLPAGTLPDGAVAIHALDAGAPIAAATTADEAAFLRALASHGAAHG